MYRILIVDDEEMIRGMLARVFARAGFEVRTAINAPHAMVLLAVESFDAVLTDVTMPSVPSMDGHDLARWVAQNYPAVGCVLMSALNVDCNSCPVAAGCKILAKPFNPHDAVARIAQVLRKSPD